MRKGPDCDYDKHNISVLICDTDIPYQLTKSLWWPYNFRDDFYLLLIIGSVTTSGNKSCIDLKDTIVANSTDNPTHTPTTFTKEEPLDNHVSVQSLCFLDIQPKMKNWIVHHSTRFQNDTSVLTACWVCRMLHETCIHIINIYFNSGQNPSFRDTVALATQWVVCIRCEIWGILKIC